MSTPKEDCEALLDVVLPVVEDFLARHGEFFPLGATMSPSGEITQAAAMTDDERPPADELIQLLTDGFRAGAASGAYRATALAFDVRVTPPRQQAARDAIAVRLDHRDRYSAVIFFPYTLADASVSLDAPFAMRGEGTIFGA